MLNHKRRGMEGIYDKNQELELRAAGFAAWEKFLIDLARTTGRAEALGVPMREGNSVAGGTGRHDAPAIS